MLFTGWITVVLFYLVLFSFPSFSTNICWSESTASGLDYCFGLVLCTVLFTIGWLAFSTH